VTPEDRRRALERIASYGERTLVCGCCSRVSAGRAEGWRAYLDRGIDERVGVLVICPSCVRLELEDAG